MRIAPITLNHPHVSLAGEQRGPPACGGLSVVIANLMSQPHISAGVGQGRTSLSIGAAAATATNQPLICRFADIAVRAG
jgi:hypothetical protein